MGRKKKKKNYTKTIGFTALVVVLLVFFKTTIFKDYNFLDNFNFNLFSKKGNIEVTQRSVQEDYSQITDEITSPTPKQIPYVEIFFSKSSGNKDVYVAVKREKFDGNASNIKYAIQTLLQGPTISERKQGICSEIPSGTKLLSQNNFLNLSSKIFSVHIINASSLLS